MNPDDERSAKAATRNSNEATGKRTGPNPTKYFQEPSSSDPAGNKAGTSRSGGASLEERSRDAIELQLTSIATYIRSHDLRPLQWTCCQCQKRQQYRADAKEIIDSFRCIDPSCGVSEKGFRLRRVHNMCGRCKVLIDERAPTTKRELKKDREDIRNQMRRMKKKWEHLDKLISFDKEEAERIEMEIRLREGREEAEREEKAMLEMEARERERAEIEIQEEERLRREWEEQEYGDPSGHAGVDPDDDYSEEEEEGYGSDKMHGRKQKYKQSQKRKKDGKTGTLKGFFRFKPLGHKTIVD